MAEKLRLKNSNILFIGVVVAILLLGIASKIYWDVDLVKSNHTVDVEDIYRLREGIIQTVLENKYKQLFVQTQGMVDIIVDDIRYEYKDRSDDLERDLKHIGLIGYTQSDLQRVFERHLSSNSTYFDGIINDSNDMFAARIGKTVEDLVIFSDFSGNCSKEGGIRGLEAELSMHFNPSLGYEAFYKINHGIMPDYKNNIFDDYIVFEFPENKKWDGMTVEFNDNGEGVKTPVFIDYSPKEFSLALRAVDGDYQKVYESLEFLAPIYILPDEDLLGVARVKNGIKQDASILVVVGVFNFGDVLNNLPDVREELAYIDGIERRIDSDYEHNLRYLLSSVGFFLLLIVVVLIMMTHYGFYRKKES